MPMDPEAQAFVDAYNAVTTRYEEAKLAGPHCHVMASQAETELIMGGLTTLLQAQSRAIDYLDALGETIDAPIAAQIKRLLVEVMP